MTNTSFSKRRLYEINPHQKDNYRALAKQLETACWDGLLDEMLPEVISSAASGEKLFLWAIESKRFFLRILAGTRRRYFIKESSIDPHVFLSTWEMN
jgi:hypothetical protein